MDFRELIGLNREWHIRLGQERERDCSWIIHTGERRKKMMIKINLILVSMVILMLAYQQLPYNQGRDAGQKYIDMLISRCHIFNNPHIPRKTGYT